MNFVDATDETFGDVVLASDVPVVVLFTAPWCTPCKAIEPHLAAIAAAHADRVQLVRIDIDANLGVPSRYDVLSLPTVIVFARGEERERILGAQPRRRYEAAVAPYLV